MTFFPVYRSTLALALSSCVICAASYAAESTSDRVSSSGAVAASKAVAGVSGQLLCAPGLEKAIVDGLGWYDTGRGLTLGTVKAGQSCALLATAAGLNVQFAGQGAVLLSGPVGYQLGTTPRRAEVSLAEPVLCESYYTANNKLAIQLTDTNGVVQTLRGFSKIDYVPSTARFVPEAVAGTRGPAVQCYAFPFASLIANPPAVPPPTTQNPNHIFSSGFDDGVNLVLDVRSSDGALSIRQLDVARDQAFQYQIRVTNTGAVAANGVRVREFVPLPAATPLLTPVVTPGSWTCTTASGPCAGAPSGTGAVNVAGLSIGPGQTYTFTLSRTVTSGSPPDKTLLGAAVFFDPEDAAGGGDRVQSDNSAPLILNLVPNQAPQFACSYPDRNLPASPSSWVWSNDLPVSVVMDEADEPVEFECRVQDRDEEAFVLAPVPTNTNPTLVSNTGLITVLGTGHFDVRIAVPADRIGTALITQTATDVREGVGRVRINVEVRDVNSPPSFTALSSTLQVSSAGAGGAILDADGVSIASSEYSRPNSCFSGTEGLCPVTFSAFLKNVSVGVQPESPGQQVIASIESCSDTGILNGTPTISPSTATSPNTPFVLAFTHFKAPYGDLNPAAEASCTIRLTDTGTPALSVTQTITIRYRP